jgi:hypothetical protein
LGTSELTPWSTAATKTKTTKTNLCVLLLCVVPAGPAHPYQKDGIAAGLKNHRAGHVEDTHLHSFAFDEQYNTYHRYGHRILLYLIHGEMPQLQPHEIAGMAWLACTAVHCLARIILAPYLRSSQHAHPDAGV